MFLLIFRASRHEKLKFWIFENIFVEDGSGNSWNIWNDDVLSFNYLDSQLLTALGRGNVFGYEY